MPLTKILASTCKKAPFPKEVKKGYLFEDAGIYIETLIMKHNILYKPMKPYETYDRTNWNIQRICLRSAWLLQNHRSSAFHDSTLKAKTVRSEPGNLATERKEHRGKKKNNTWSKCHFCGYTLFESIWINYDMFWCLLKLMITPSDFVRHWCQTTKHAVDRSLLPVVDRWHRHCQFQLALTKQSTDHPRDGTEWSECSTIPTPIPLFRITCSNLQNQMFKKYIYIYIYVRVTRLVASDNQGAASTDARHSTEISAAALIVQRRMCWTWQSARSTSSSALKELKWLTCNFTPKSEGWTNAIFSLQMHLTSHSISSCRKTKVQWKCMKMWVCASWTACVVKCSLEIFSPQIPARRASIYHQTSFTIGAFQGRRAPTLCRPIWSAAGLRPCFPVVSQADFFPRLFWLVKSFKHRTRDGQNEKTSGTLMSIISFCQCIFCPDRFGGPWFYKTVRFLVIPNVAAQPDLSRKMT